MSYHEKRTLVSIVAGILLLGAYCINSFHVAQSGLVEPDNLKYWAGTILVFFGIGMAAIIVIQIVFHILMSVGIAAKETLKGKKEAIDKTIKATFVDDEMVKLIELKTSRVGYSVVGLGFVASLIAVVSGVSSVAMLHIIFLSMFVGSLVEGFMSLYYFRRGVRNV